MYNSCKLITRKFSTATSLQLGERRDSQIHCVSPTITVAFVLPTFSCYCGRDGMGVEANRNVNYRRPRSLFNSEFVKQ